MKRKTKRQTLEYDESPLFYYVAVFFYSGYLSKVTVQATKTILFILKEKKLAKKNNLNKSLNLDWNFLEEAMTFSSSVNLFGFTLTNGAHQDSQVGWSCDLRI
jgi:hypothetical protein